MQVFETIIDKVRVEGSSAINSLGYKVDTISSEILKYSCELPEIKHIMVFLSQGKPKSLTFVFDNGLLAFSELKSKMGDFTSSYNYRDNYTEFAFSQSYENIERVFFIVDNKYESDADRFVETTPYGDKKYHNDINMDCFCLGIKGDAT